MSWGTEKTPGVQKMTENGGDHVLCTTVYNILLTIRFISTKVTDLFGHHVATDCFKFKDSHQANILTIKLSIFGTYYNI